MPFGVLFRAAPPGSRRHRFAQWWRKYVGSIAFMSLLVVAGIGFARIENARYEACEGGNLLRQGLREAEEQGIEVTEATDPRLFPDIPPTVFGRLIHEGVARSERLIRVNYADHDCGTKIDLPLTDAAIVFPP
jgi:hypothetical protein